MVQLSGTSNLRIGGRYVVVEGLYFVNGYSPSGAVIEFRRSSGSEAENCRLTNCAIVDYNPVSNSTDYKWISLYGKNNRVDHCYIRGKKHSGTTLVVWLSSTPNYHIIDHNYFAHRPALGVNGGETIRVGTSDWSMYDSFTLVEKNYFEECDGEIEIISNKSCGNIYRYNTFVKNNGTLTLRHGNRCTVESNFFFGFKKSGSGGVRIIGEDHKVFNNYFFELTGSGFRSALSMVNGIPDSPLNEYFQVKNAVVAFNTFVNCTNNFNIGTGASTTQSLPPLDCMIANNIVKGSVSPLIKYEAAPINLQYEGNIMFGAALGITQPSGIEMTDPLLVLTEDTLYRPQIISPAVDAALGSYPYVEYDIDGQPRSGLKDIGADEISTASVTNYPIKPGEAGPSWLDIILNGLDVIALQPGLNTLYNAVASAQPFSVIELDEGIYPNDSTIKINKHLTIRAKTGLNTKPVVVNASDNPDAVLIEINQGALLYLDRIEFNGLSSGSTPAKHLIATSETPIVSPYRLIVYNCDFKDVNSGSFFYAYPGTLADSIKFRNCLFTIASGTAIKIDNEQLNSSKINVKYLEVYNSTFWDIAGTAVSVYGGDNTSSTIAPLVKINHCTFNNTGYNNNYILNLKDADGADVVSSLFTNSTNLSSIYISGSSSKMHYCDTFNVGPVVLDRGAVKGSGMLGVDPLYNNPAAGNFMLSSSSPVLSKAYDFYAMGDLRWDPNVVNVEEKLYGEKGYVLLQNYPNPFNPSTSIEFILERRAHVQISIYNIQGVLVSSLLDEESDKGTHRISWIPEHLASGIYFCTLKSPVYNKTIKLMYLK
jgi:hypothetical protein